MTPVGKTAIRDGSQHVPSPIGELSRSNAHAARDNAFDRVTGSLLGVRNPGVLLFGDGSPKHRRVPSRIRTLPLHERQEL